MVADLSENKFDVVCIGAGPAGLTAAYKLSQAKQSVLVLEADSKYVGGISKTVNYKDFLFDIGGHRFFSKSQEIEDFWTEILGDEMLQRPRKSRVYYKNKFFDYPLKPVDALFKLGILESVNCVLSYLWVKCFPLKIVKSFEDWVVNNFGHRLFKIFFKTYTEKVWGMDCSEISSDWAAQRIKGLSLTKAVWNSLFKPKSQNNGQVIKTLIDSFRYPKKGPGQMWEVTAKKIIELGGEIKMDAKVFKLVFNSEENIWDIYYQNSSGQLSQVKAKHLISSVPIKEVVNSLEPTALPEAVNAANNLRYRDFLTVALIVDLASPPNPSPTWRGKGAAESCGKGEASFDDNWIYIHDPNVKVGRVQNYKSWSEDMVPEKNKACYGLEYFCFEGDGLWESTDEELIELAKRELSQIQLVKKEQVVDGCVVRQKKAYPVYDANYQQNLETIKKELKENYPNLHLVGRNGMHKYNNQDHSMMTAIYAAKNIIEDKLLYDLWKVNQDAEYIEETKSTNDFGGRLIPENISNRT